jgi:hypothetical protein
MHARHYRQIASRIAALGYDYPSQPKQAVTSCNLCGASYFVVLTHRDRYGYPAQAHACRRAASSFSTRHDGGVRTAASITASIVRS